MSHREFYEKTLQEHLTAHPDVAPPWEEFPEYERYSIGWRMGSGETWMGLWGVFLEKLDKSFETRLAYLKSHAPSPMCWSDTVYSVLYPDEYDDFDDSDEDEEREKAARKKRRARVFELGLIASDVAYTTWRKKRPEIEWVWHFSESPVNAARYWTRDLWFWSRQVSEVRGTDLWKVPDVPEAWKVIEGALLTGDLPELNLNDGLLSLTQMMAAGKLIVPWKLGLRVADFRDSFDVTMGYVDAFRLWIMSAVDDREYLEKLIIDEGAPPDWVEWMGGAFFVER